MYVIIKNIITSFFDFSTFFAKILIASFFNFFVFFSTIILLTIISCPQPLHLNLKSAPTRRIYHSAQPQGCFFLIVQYRLPHIQSSLTCTILNQNEYSQSATLLAHNLITTIATQVPTHHLCLCGIEVEDFFDEVNI